MRKRSNNGIIGENCAPLMVRLREKDHHMQTSQKKHWEKEQEGGKKKIFKRETVSGICKSHRRGGEKEISSREGGDG